MDPLLVFPDPAPPEIVQWLDLAGFPWKAVADEQILVWNRDAAGHVQRVVQGEDGADEPYADVPGFCRAVTLAELLERGAPTFDR